MIETNKIEYKKELEEVVYMFSTGEDLKIYHQQEENGFEYVDTVILNEQKTQTTNYYEHKGELDKKRFQKRFSKLALYKALTNHYNVNLTWGSLTGIRPVKMARDLGENYKTLFKEIFEVTDKKIKVVEDILNTQRDLFDKNGEYTCLFVGIPFCPSRCYYCSFVSEIISKTKYEDVYVNALISEILALKGKMKNLRSIYVGGGTPVCLKSENFSAILSAINSVCDGKIEFTVEAGRPDVITKEKLDIMKANNVTRICINPQTFLDKTLKVIGRKHTALDIENCIELAKSYGFIINADLIAGLTGESFDDFKYSLDRAISFGLENITVHTLCLKKGAELKLSTDRLRVLDIDKMIDYSHEKLKREGYNPYYLYRQKYAANNLENVGFCKPNTECLYNIDVMEENSTNYACGANAVSKRVFTSENRIERYGTPKDIKTYIDKISKIIEEKSIFFE